MAWNKGKKIVKRISCSVCGKEIYRQPHDIKKTTHSFCSRVCQGEFQRKRKKIVCPICGKIKTIKNYEKNKFCSSICVGKSYKGEKSPVFSQIKKACLFCGKEIMVQKCFENKRKFCSRDCANKYHSVKMTGVGNPAWKNGIGKLPYSYEFRKELKNEIKKRDGMKCKLCFGNQRLSIHHIDYDKKNNDLCNLITLCEVCHAKTNYDRKKWTKELLEKLNK